MMEVTEHYGVLEAKRGRIVRDPETVVLEVDGTGKVTRSEIVFGLEAETIQARRVVRATPAIPGPIDNIYQHIRTDGLLTSVVRQSDGFTWTLTRDGNGRVTNVDTSDAALSTTITRDGDGYPTFVNVETPPQT